jgi:hypothetical protein
MIMLLFAQILYLMNIKKHGMIVPSLDYIDHINYDHRTDNGLKQLIPIWSNGKPLSERNVLELEI